MHTERLENAFTQLVAVGLAAYLFNYYPQHLVVRVAVGELATGPKFERLVAKESNLLSRRVGSSSSMSQIAYRL